MCLATSAYSAVPSLKAVNAANKQQQLGTSYDLGYSLSKSAGAAQALSLTHGDFNTDGFQDLVSGYATDTGGMITLHRGNEEAYAPSTAVSLAGVKQGVFPPGFVAQSSVYSVPVAPDFIVAGDFNRDGDMDLLVAKRNDAAMYFLSGGRSGFGAARKIALAGGVDALASGQIDMPDGMADFAVAISNASGASLLVYNELAGINGKAQSYKLPASADALEVGNLDDSPMGDIAILANGKALVLHGYDQGAKATSYNRLETLDFDFPIQAFALGDFIWDRGGLTELALLKADGSVHFAAHGTLNTTAFSVAEVRALRRQQAAVKSVSLKSWQPGQGGAWNIVESTEAQLSKGIAVRGAKLFSARLSGKASDDLVIVDALTQSLQILSKSGDTRSVSKVVATSAPVAAIAMQTSSFGLNSLISLGTGAHAASVLPSAPLATFTVSKTADTNDGTCNADCSLREAIGAANAAAGADSIVLPAGTYQLTIANGGGLNEDNNAQGDLDVNDALTITGAGAGTTIVRAGTTTSDGIDKVFAFNPLCVSPMATAISGISISFGRNAQPTSAPDFSYTGGGMDWCGTGNSSMTVTNAIINNNTNTLGYGGGINLDSFAANGSVVITGTTISGNRALSTLGNNTGGGVNLFGDQHNVTITNGNITGNTAAGEGAGLFVRHTNGGAVLVQGTNLANNIASSRGGGISNVNLGASTFTINQDSSVVNNISQGLAGLAAEGGGIYSNAAATTTINEVTITNNAANGAGAPEQRGGGGIATGGGTVNVTFNRIAGNSALGLGGSGIHKDLNAGTTTATNNWWGCNAGAASAPCDRAVLAAGAGTLTSTPHLVLNHAASPNAIVVGQTSALTADFLTNSASTAIAVSNLDAIIGTTHAHQNPVRGAHSATQTSIQAAGSATATFTATAPGAGSSDSVVDSQTRIVTITITKANTVTTITSDNPDPSVVGGVVAVNYTVAVAAPGAGTATGNVVVTVSGGAETCTGTVAAGTCNITLTAVGSRTLTATYAGDANFNGSAGTNAHTVSKANTATTISSDTPDPSNVGQAVTVNFSVAVSAPGAGTATGNVTITAAGGAETCTASVAVGTCMITLSAGGARDLTATYAGDASFNTSVSALAAHAVVIPQVVTLAFNGAASSANENSGIGSVLRVTTDNLAVTGAAATVTVSVSGGTANVTDYSLTGTITIPAGTAHNALVSIASGITVTGDSIFENDDTLQLTLSAPTSAVLGAQSTLTHTIVNDDTAPTLAINDVSVTEGNSGTTLMNFTVTRTGPTDLLAGFTATSADGTATLADSDYLALSLAFSVAAGGASNTQTVTVVVNGDTQSEANEQLLVNLTAATNATFSDAQGVGTITNDDAAPVLSINDVAINEGNAGTSTLTFTVTRTGATASAVGFNFASADNTATISDPDYSAVSGTGSILAGGASGTTTVNVLINGDAVFENTESFFVNLTAPTNATIGDAQGIGTITNDDTAPTLAINDVSITEGNTGTQNLIFTVTRSGLTALPATFTAATANGTATAPSDYLAALAGSTSIAAGGATGTTTLTATINGDAVVEANETLFVNLTVPVNATIFDNQGIGTITNDDSAGIILIQSLGTTDVTEGGATDSYTLVLTSQPTGNVSIALSPDAQVTVATSPVVFTTVNWNVAQTVTVTAVDDVLVEGPHTGTVAHVVTSTDASYNSFALANVVANITDNDLPTLAINDVAISEGNSGTSVLTFTVTRTGITPSAVGFSFASADGTATIADSDYVTATSIGSIPSGGAAGTTTVSVTINGDPKFENTESFAINLSAPTNATISDNQGIGTITNDDTAPTLAINDVLITEGNSGTQNLSFTVTRTGLTALPATFTAATADGTATAPSDYLAALVGSTSIAAGGATGTTTLTATINGDAVVEANETFLVNLSVPANATISDNQGVGTINNDDTAGIVLSQSLGSTDVTEGGATDSYTLVLTSQPTSNVTITLNTGTQVTVGPSPVIFTSASWNVAQTVTVTAVDDALVEGPHTGTISHAVTSLDASYNAFAVANVVANITDNDLPSLAINDVSITEGNAGTQVLTFTVTRTGATPFAVGFDFATADNTATVADNDYAAASGTVSIPSGGATASTTVSVTINGDLTFENNESFLVNLTAPTNALISDAQGAGTITNDETAPTLAINDVSLVEGNSGTQNMVFTVTRTGLTALPASFKAATTNGTATEPSDYLSAVVGSTMIPAGGATATTTLSVTINGDLTIEPNEFFSLDLSAPLNATIADNQGIGTITNDDGEPTFTPAGPITRQQGSPAAIATLGTVSDLTDPANSLAVAIIADTTTGVSTTGLANSNGNVTATLAAACTASAGNLTLRVTDSGGLTDTDIVAINVSPNTAPALAYGAANVSVGNSLTITPSTALSDNGNVTSVTVLSSGTYTGGISVSNSGVISLSNATPAGSHTLVIRATDNCGANRDANVALTIGQASTFKLITSNVSPSRFGEAVTFSVALSGVNPSGTVEFFAGATSLGTAPLVASPSGGANLKLANLTTSTLSVGTSVITARYAGDVNNVASVSADLAHIVSSAGTRITLTPAANPAPVGPVSIAVLVAPEAPGGGVPAGSVTLSSGALSCTAPLTAGAGSCVLNFASVGYQAITASYTPTGSNHAASIGGSAVVIVATPSSTDLRVRIGNGVSNIGAGQALSYLIVVDNLGTQAAVGRLQVPVSADFVGASYTCISAVGATCGAGGSGSIDTEVSLAPAGVVIYRFNVTAPLAPERTVSQTASVTTKVPTTDTDATNNSAADIDPMGFLADGYEDAVVTE